MEEDNCDVSESENDFVTHIFLSLILKSNKIIVDKILLMLWAFL